jgi:hypothetical protein
VRGDQEAVVVNLDLPDVEPHPEEVRWIDDIHKPTHPTPLPQPHDR